MKYRDKTDNILVKYGKNLPKTHRKFLEAKDHRGFSNRMDDGQNPYQTRKDIMKNMGNSLKLIYDTLKLTKNLKKDEIYDIFNAQNIQLILETLLRDTRKNYDEPSQGQYDFRTCEIARLMLELSLKYLKESPAFSQVSSVKELSKSLSKDFRVLSKSMLEKENQYQTISKEEQDKIEAKYLQIEEKVDSYPFETSAELFIEIQRLDFEYIELKKLKRVNYMKHNKVKRKEAYEKYQKRLDYETRLEDNEFRNKSMLMLESRKKYDHISSYFSKIIPLGDIPINRM